MDAMAASGEGEAKALPPIGGSVATDSAISRAKTVRTMLMGSLLDAPQYPPGAPRQSSDILATSV